MSAKFVVRQGDLKGARVADPGGGALPEALEGIEEGYDLSPAADARPHPAGGAFDKLPGAGPFGRPFGRAQGNLRGASGDASAQHAPANTYKNLVHP